MANNGRTTSTNGAATGRLPEILTAPSLAEWFAAWVEAHVEADEREALEAGNSRLRRAEFAMVKNAAAQVAAYHGPESVTAAS